MAKNFNQKSDRRQFIKTAAAVSALSNIAIPRVHAQEGERNEIRVSLIGSGFRGTGATADALKVESTKLKLVAMADVFEHRISKSYDILKEHFSATPEKIDVPPDQQFVGFDAYRHAMDVLRPGDIAIFASPLAFRPLHLEYAIKRGLHVFMEKPIVADGVSAKKMFQLAKLADAKSLKCGVGLMVRHCRGRQELHKRISEGEIGDLINMRAYRMQGPAATCFSTRKPPERQELLWQIERFHSFIWASGGLFSDFYVHQIDEACWMKNAWPVKAQAIGGRHFREDYVDQNFDVYSVEYTFEDGSKFFFDGRTMNGCYNNMSTVVHGSNGSAIVSDSGHTPGRVRTFSGQRQHRRDVVWAYPQPEQNPYQLEWNDLVDAIRNDTPYNEVPRSVEACLVTNMGRMAAHTGQEITFQQALDSPHEMAPQIASFTPDGPAPVMPDEEGRYPIPIPGVLQDTEYKVT